MPYNELDLIILKHLLTNKKHALDFIQDNKSNLFSPDIWNFANSIISYIKNYKEIPTQKICNEKLAKNNPKTIQQINEVFSALSNTLINDQEYLHDLEKIKARLAEKELSNIKNMLEKSDLTNTNKVVSDLQKTIQTINDLHADRAYDSQDIKDYLDAFVDQYNSKKNNPNANLGIKTNYSFLDYCTNGLKPSDFLLIAGETGFGKSLFLNNIAVQTWLQNNQINSAEFSTGKNIIYFSLEMPYEDCFNRLISRLSGVPSRDIENANLNKEDMQKVKNCLAFIKAYPYQFKIVDIPDASANDIEAILVDAGETYDAVFVDYLGIMKTNDKSDEADWLKQGIIAYETRSIARRHNLPILSAVQLNRKGQGKDSSDNIGLSRLARSSTIATHATHIIQIESRNNENLFPDFIYHMIKNRKGPKGKGVLLKNLSCATLIDKNDKADDQMLNDYFHDAEDISEEIEDLEF